MKRTFGRLWSTASVLALTIGAPAWAQDQANTSGDNIEEVVVTGTLLRGVAPAGAEVMNIDTSDIVATGATSTAQLLANIPGTQDFGAAPSVQGANNTQQSTNRPNLRNLPNFAGGSPTLILMDGHQLPGAGIIQTSPDSDSIPPGVIERVEVVLDGGSSIYGSDAVGGVINYITRKSFDGIEVNARQGIADGGYQSTDGYITGGKDWGSGSAYVSYDYSQHNAIYGRDLDFVKRIDWATGKPTNLLCNPGTAAITNAGVTTQYALPGLAPNTSNVCDPTDPLSIYPIEHRDTLFGSIRQDIGAHIRLSLKTWYTKRIDKSDGGPPTGSVTINPSNPYYEDTGDANSGRPQQVSFSFADVWPTTRQLSTLETWGFTPSLSADLWGDWQLDAFVNYGRSDTVVDLNQTSSTALNAAAAGTTTATALDPYNPAQTNSSVLAAIRDSQQYGRSVNELDNARAVVNGTLFSLPGGDVRAAIGSEWSHERYKEIQGTVALGAQNTLIPVHDTRDVYAFFGELHVPVVSPANAIPLVHSLNVAMSARYDHYSDFGGTTNPQIGVTYEPIDWIDIRGDWGKSFQAPSLADTAAATPQLIAFPGVIFQNPYAAPPPNLLMYELFLSGAVKGLQPEKANSYSVGTDVRPPIIPNLDLGFTYYNIEFLDQVAQALPGINVPFSQFWQTPALATTYPTPAQIAQFAALAGAQGANTLAGTDPTRGVYALLNTLRQNLSNSWLNGFDVSAHYTHDTDFGSLYANVSGTYRLSNITQLGNGAPKSGNLASNESRFQFVATIGAMVGDNFRAQASLNHLGGFNVAADSSDNFQSFVKSFNSLNLYFEYDLNGTGLAQNTSLNLTVNNLFDQDPSSYHGTYIARYDGYANPVSSIGRLIELGIDKKF